MTTSANNKNLFQNLFSKFDSIPHVIELNNYRIYTVTNIGQTIAWMAHLSWMFVFYFLNVPPMQYIQFASIFTFIIAIYMNRKGFHTLAIFLSMSDIVMHQIFAVHFVGWECGFQYYIPVFVIFPILIPKGNTIMKWLMFLICLGGFLYIDFYARKTIPLYMLAERPIVYLRLSNIVLSFGCFAMWALYLTKAVNRSQAIIEQQTKAQEAGKQAEIQLMLELKEKENIIIHKEKEQNQKLLLNVLPHEVAMELIENGKSRAKTFESVTVLFTDIKDFTKITERMDGEHLVKEIDYCFSNFDNIISKFNIEKIKTIGDAYMCAGGLPVANSTHANDVVAAAIEINKFMIEHLAYRKSVNKELFEIRIGIHTGPVVAGIVGIKKFAYDIWGDTVNIASRMESSGEPGKINISGSTYQLVKNDFTCVHRGKIQAKNKGEVDMYFVS